MIAVAIPSIPPRADRLGRAVRSVLNQTLPPDEIAVAVDTGREGAAATRNRAWQSTTAEWVAFVDDDDELLPKHLEVCWQAAVEHDADFVYPWFEVVDGGVDPFPDHFGKPWDPAEPRQTTITGLWRRTALEQVGGFPPPGDDVDADGNRIGEDYTAVLRLNDLGGRIVHVAERTWLWSHHEGNTSGRPDRW